MRIFLLSQTLRHLAGQFRKQFPRQLNDFQPWHARTFLSSPGDQENIPGDARRIFLFIVVSTLAGWLAGCCVGVQSTGPAGLKVGTWPDWLSLLNIITVSSLGGPQSSSHFSIWPIFNVFSRQEWQHFPMILRHIPMSACLTPKQPQCVHRWRYWGLG